MNFCWFSFVSGGYNDNTKISKFLRNGASEERLFYDFKNHYLCFSPSLTPTIEAILRGSHGEIFTKKKIMRRATYAVVKLKEAERRRRFGDTPNYFKNNYNYSDYLSSLDHVDDLVDKPDDPILINYTHYYYKEENPIFGLKYISLIKRQSNKDKKTYYVMVYSFLNFDVASIFLQKIFDKKFV